MNTYKKTYLSWQGMRQRCNNPNNKDFKSYGGRGIRVDPMWDSSFQEFLRDMGQKPEGSILDRIEVNGDYCKSNCRWTDHVTSGINRRPFAAETKLRKNNKYGIAGLYWDGNSWRVKVGGSYAFRTPDFFEACCFRKSYEIHNQR